MNENYETHLSYLTVGTSGQTESQAEYILPDYLSDMRKLLYYSVELYPASSYKTEEGSEHSGIVTYNVLYLDEEGELSSVSFSSDYDLSVGGGEATGESALAELQASSVRIAGPRKLIGKASVCVGALRLREVLSESVIEERDDAEVASRVLNSADLITTEETEREYAEPFISIEGAIKDEVSTPLYSASVCVSGIDTRDGAVNLKGHILVRALVRNDEEAPYPRELKIPIDEELAVENIPDGATVFPRTNVSSVTLSVNQSESGVNIVASVIATYGIVAVSNKAVEVVTDAYLKSRPSSSEYGESNYHSLRHASFTLDPVAFEVPRTELGGESLQDIILASANTKIDSTIDSDGNLIHSGEIKISGVYTELSDDGRAVYQPMKLNFPYEKKIMEHMSDRDLLRSSVRAHASTTDVSFDHETVFFNLVLEVETLVTESKTERVLRSLTAREGEEYARSSSEITVYYPDPDETLFSVARRFHTTPKKLALDNLLDVSVSADPTSSLVGTKKLLIF